MGTPVSLHVVRDWLADNNFALHKLAKVIAGGKSPFRNAQFENINTLDTVVRLMRRTATNTGLGATVNVIRPPMKSVEKSPKILRPI